MILKTFTVFDKCANAHITPFFMPQNAMAERMFTQMVNDQEHQFSRAPNDYTLYRIGSFDDETGMLEPCSPEQIATGTQVKEDG